MPTIDLAYCREVREEDAVYEGSEQHEPSPIELASDAFREFLHSLHRSGSGGASGFVVRGYAALWALDIAVFEGKTQREVAMDLGVAPETFNRALAQWTSQFGLVTNSMRPRAARFKAISDRRSGRRVKP